jgi:hypothetical protein
MTKADKTVAFRPSLEVWEKLQQESNYSVAIEAALKLYYGIEGVTAQSDVMERLERLEEHCILDEGMLKEVALQARSRACENEDVIITLDDRIFALEESNKKSVIAFQSSQANFKAEIDNLTAKIESLENNPSQDSQEEVINVNQVSEVIEGATDPVSGIEAERLAPIGIQAKELCEILDIPQTTLSDWGRRRERGEGKPSRGGHKDKWEAFMKWEKREGKWYRY